jgi:hypothetical protein
LNRSGAESLSKVSSPYCYKTTNKFVDELAIFLLMHFWNLPQHVSASHWHHQGVVVSSEATQAVSIVDVYGLWQVQSVQLWRDVTKRVRGFGSCGESPQEPNTCQAKVLAEGGEPNPLYTLGYIRRQLTSLDGPYAIYIHNTDYLSSF